MGHPAAGAACFLVCVSLVLTRACFQFTVSTSARPLSSKPTEITVNTYIGNTFTIMLRTLQEASLKSRRVFLENHSFGKPERSRFAINQHKGRLHPRTHLQVCWRSASSRARELVFSWGSSLALEKTQMPKDSSEPVLESGPFCHLHHRALPPPCAGEQVSQQ